MAIALCIERQYLLAQFSKVAVIAARYSINIHFLQSTVIRSSSEKVSFELGTSMKHFCCCCCVGRDGIHFNQN